MQMMAQTQIDTVRRRAQRNVSTFLLCAIAPTCSGFDMVWPPTTWTFGYSFHTSTPLSRPESGRRRENEVKSLQ